MFITLNIRIICSWNTIRIEDGTPITDYDWGDFLLEKLNRSFAVYIILVPYQGMLHRIQDISLPHRVMLYGLEKSLEVGQKYHQ